MLEDNDDMEADIRAAFSGEPSGVIAPEPADIVINAEPETATPEVEKTSNRDESGKFVAKQKEAEQDTPEQPLKVETPQESIRPPASWSAQAKAAFVKDVPTKEDLALIQREVLKREADIDKGFRERAEQLKRYEPLEQVIAPHRQKWSVQGVDEATAVRQLLAASDWLERDPAQAIAYLAKQYGVANVTGQPLAQPVTGNNGQPSQAQPNPVESQLQALQQKLDAIEAGRQQESQAALVSQIDAFKSNPANLYFENVKDEMAMFLQAGKAQTLEDAYDMACNARPDIRPLLRDHAAKLAADKAKVAAARNAGVSVTGSPGNGSLPPSNGSIEDDVRRAVTQISGRA